MVFKSVRGLVPDRAPTWTFSLSACYVIQDHPAHIPWGPWSARRGGCQRPVECGQSRVSRARGRGLASHTPSLWAPPAAKPVSLPPDQCADYHNSDEPDYPRNGGRTPITISDHAREAGNPGGDRDTSQHCLAPAWSTAFRYILNTGTVYFWNAYRSGRYATPGGGSPRALRAWPLAWPSPSTLNATPSRTRCGACPETGRGRRRVDGPVLGDMPGMRP